MEPLVLFGACLVIYCGYLSALDAVRVWKRQFLAVSLKKQRSRKRARPVRYVRSPRYGATVATGRALLQRG